MKELLVYFSETGFTKKYVESIERRIPGIEVVFIKKLKKKQIKESDMIIFISPLRGNKIRYLDKFLKYYDLMEKAKKDIFIIATGIEPISDSKKEGVILANALNYYHVRLYLLPSGIDISKMSKFKQKMLRMSIKVASKKEPMLNNTLDMFSRCIDFTNINLLDPILEKYHSVKIRRNTINEIKN